MKNYTIKDRRNEATDVYVKGFDSFMEKAFTSEVLTHFINTMKVNESRDGLELCGHRVDVIMDYKNIEPDEDNPIECTLYGTIYGDFYDINYTLQARSYDDNNTVVLDYYDIDEVLISDIRL